MKCGKKVVGIVFQYYTKALFKRLSQEFNSENEPVCVCVNSENEPYHYS